MNRKFICLSIFIFLIWGCDVGSKNKKSGPSRSSESLSIEGEEEKVDSDFDGVPDEDEIKVSREPYISDIPYVGVFEVEKLDFSAYFDNSENYSEKAYSFEFDLNKESIQNEKGELLPNVINNNLVRSKIANVIYNSIFNGSNDISYFPSLETYFVSEFGCFSEKSQLNNIEGISYLDSYLDYDRSSLNIRYKYLFRNLEDINEIRDLSVEALFSSFNEIALNEPVLLRNVQNVFKFNGVESFNFLKTFEENLVTKNILGINDIDFGHRCFYSKVEDFSYVRNSRRLDFKEVLSGVESNNAQVVISTPKETSWVSVSLEKFKKLTDVLNYFEIKFLIDNQLDFAEVATLSSQIELLKISTIKDEISLNKKRWFFVNTVLKSVDEELEEGAHYYLFYGSTLELFEFSGEEKEILNNIYLNQPININDVRIGDKYLVVAELESKILMEPSSYGKFDGLRRVCTREHEGPRDKQLHEKRNCHWEHYRNGCEFWEDNKFPDLLNWKSVDEKFFLSENLKVKFNGREIPFFKLASNKIGMIIDTVGSDSFKSVSQISINSISKNKYPYIRLRKEEGARRGRGIHCVQGDRRFEVTREAHREFRYKMNIKRFGVTR